ncbi:MAG: protein-disulfide reductase DsbD [Pseudomonadota bacterium]|nr:protein-disulfide reductase DsbD [Pseudomonadota bacterium]
MNILPKEEAFQLITQPNGKDIVLTWDIAENCYLYQKMFRFHWQNASGDTLLTLSPEAWPEGIIVDDPEFGRVTVFKEQLQLQVSLPERENLHFLKIEFQGCLEDTLCYPPQHHLEPIAPFQSDPALSTSNVADKTTNDSKSAADSGFSFATDNESLEARSMWLNLVIFFLLGLGLTFTPCVLPMVPIISSQLVQHQGQARFSALKMSAAYVLGMAITYTTLGVLIGLLGSQFNLAFYLQNPWVLAAVASLFFILSLSLFGVFELQLPGFIRDKLTPKAGDGQARSFFGFMAIGALSALVVSPCISPPLAGSLLYISATGSALSGGAMLFVMALGMGVPLILVAVAGNSLLPKSGAWLLIIKHLMGFLLVAVGLYLLKALLPVLAEYWLWIIFIFAVAAYLFYARRFVSQRVSKRSFVTCSILIAVLGAVLSFAVITKNQALTKPLTWITQQSLQAPAVTFYDITVKDTKSLDKALAKAQKDGDAVILDFYADWCISCIVMNRQVFNQPDILAMSEAFQVIKLDVTTMDEPAQALLRRYDVIGLPAIYAFDSAGNEQKDWRILGELDHQAFKQKLELLNEKLTESH